MDRTGWYVSWFLLWLCRNKINRIENNYADWGGLTSDCSRNLMMFWVMFSCIFLSCIVLHRLLNCSHFRFKYGYTPATVILFSQIEPLRILRRVSWSLPTVRMFLYMSRRLPATVNSSTGCWISPFSTQNPKAPRE